MRSSSRPLPISLIAILSFVLAGVFGFRSLTLLPNTDFSDRQSSLEFLWQVGNAGLGVALGIGLWRCARWAWWLFATALTVTLLQSVWQLLLKWDAVPSSDLLLTLAVPFLILLYLNQPQVRQAFGFEPEQPEQD
jgi:hypothetical protein